MRKTANKAGTGYIIAAAMILFLGVAFGVWRLSGGYRQYQARPSREEIQGRYELLDHLEALEDILVEIRDPEELDGDALLREWLEDTRMSRWQQEQLRENLDTVTELAREGSVGLETARNHLIREQIYVNQLLSDRETAERGLRISIVFGGACIAIGVIGAGACLMAARKKKREAEQAAASESYNKEF